MRHDQLLDLLLVLQEYPQLRFDLGSWDKGLSSDKLGLDLLYNSESIVYVWNKDTNVVKPVPNCLDPYRRVLPFVD